MPYIVEWLEFMRLQGVTRFVIYDDNSTDGLHLLPALYASKGIKHVHVVSSHRGALCFGPAPSALWVCLRGNDSFICCTGACC